MTPQNFFDIARRGWRLLLFCIVAALAVGCGYLLLTPPTYQSVAVVYVSTSQASNVNDLNQGSTFTQQVVKSYADVATTPFVLDFVIRDLHLQTTAAKLATSVAVSAPVDTTVLQVVVTEGNPTRAAQIANGIVQRMQSAVVVLSPSSTGPDGTAVRLTQIQVAQPPTQAVAPSTKTVIGTSLIIGLVVGLVLLLLRDRYSSRYVSPEDVGLSTGMPLIGVIPKTAAVVSDSGLYRSDPMSQFAESIRVLRANLRFVSLGTDASVIVVTSATEGEGKSATAVNLALSLSDTGLAVLLIDADLRRPKIGEYLGLDGSVGLTDVLISNVDIEEAIQVSGSEGLKVLPSGMSAPNPNELLQSEQMKLLIESSARVFDVIIIDSAPVLAVADASVLAAHGYGLLMVLDISSTRRREFTMAVEGLARVGAQTMGVVVTKARGRAIGSYGTEYYSAGSARDSLA